MAVMYGGQFLAVDGQRAANVISNTVLSYVKGLFFLHLHCLTSFKPGIELILDTKQFQTPSNQLWKLD
jgi:hypothetical protein